MKKFLYLTWLWRKLTYKRFYFSYQQWLCCRRSCQLILKSTGSYDVDDWERGVRDEHPS